MSKGMLSKIPLILSIVLLFFLCQKGWSQDSLIIKMKQDDPRHNIFKRGMRIRPLIPSLGLYQVFVDHGRTAREAREEILKMPGVIYVVGNPKVSNRSRSNDPLLREQWSYTEDQAHVNVFKAWDFGVGGRDILNRRVIVAVIDSGFDIEHEDLAANMWKNSLETYGNGADDDGNGYKDDYHGWNAYEDTADVHSEGWSATHGTHIAGIIGAKGNNGLGVAGVNWNANIMPIVGSSHDTATVMIAFNYIMNHKESWIRTKGKKGANIVVVNASFGVDGADCESEEFAVWNEVYNALGRLGILSVVAAPNEYIDIDEQGDVPTGCSSPYLIKVTSMDRTGQLDSYSAYGQTFIDVAAPGSNVLSTIPGNSYSQLSGTSMATPHVSGAIALLHSVASLNFQRFYQEDPSSAILELRNSVLDAATKSTHWDGLVSSGGYLNIGAAAWRLKSFHRENGKKKNNILSIIDDFTQIFESFDR